jgi:hypothetical protein
MTEIVAPIRIEGLAQFSRALRKLDADAPKGLRLAFNEAADVVIARVRPKVPTLSGRARRSVKAKSTRTQARVAVGGPSAPYFPWLDFGGRVGRRKRTVRPFIKEGRYLFPGLSESHREVQAVLERALSGVVRSSGLEEN